jgi:uncharacterized membrane protein YhaH (DUF805 family)
MHYYFKVLQNYANFNGRARRSEYWFFFLFNFTILVLLSVFGAMTGSMLLYGLYAVGVFIPGFAVAVRRMHDVNKSGWYAFIPIYNLILAFTEGDSGDNDYGPDPKTETVTE